MVLGLDSHFKSSLTASVTYQLFEFPQKYHRVTMCKENFWLIDTLGNYRNKAILMSVMLIIMTPFLPSAYYMPKHCIGPLTYNCF